MQKQLEVFVSDESYCYGKASCNCEVTISDDIKLSKRIILQMPNKKNVLHFFSFVYNNMNLHKHLQSSHYFGHSEVQRLKYFHEPNQRHWNTHDRSNANIHSMKQQASHLTHSMRRNTDFDNSSKYSVFPAVH